MSAQDVGYIVKTEPFYTIKQVGNIGTNSFENESGEKYYVDFIQSVICVTLCTKLTCRVWQCGLWSFQTVGTKLERFLPKEIIEF